MIRFEGNTLDIVKSYGEVKGKHPLAGFLHSYKLIKIKKVPTNEEEFMVIGRKEEVDYVMLLN